MKDMNNRIIKFRAIGVSGKMHYWELTDAQSDWVSPDEPIGEIMQFSGLIDKHGKEVFEGDVCWTYEVGIGNLNRVVIFDSGSFCFRHDKALTEPIRGWKSDYIEVIGSIHSTPELLNL